MRSAAVLTLLLVGFLVPIPAVADLFQRHGSESEIWKYDGTGRCSNDACPGWTKIDKNQATEHVSAGFGGLYQRHHDGSIWRYDGSGVCPPNNNPCPGWTRIDHNQATASIAGGPGGFYQRHTDGQIWKYDGHGQCTTKRCPGWTLIDRNLSTQDIAAANGTLIQKHNDGEIYLYDGRGQCSPNPAIPCPGWTKIDANMATRAIAGASVGIYQRHSTGFVFKHDGHTPCTPNGCLGWTQIDANPETQSIFAGGSSIYQLHGSKTLHRHDGRSQCLANPCPGCNRCPGWTLIDKNQATTDVSVDSATVYQRHGDGQIYKHDGRGECGGDSCPGWTLIDRNAQTTAILAVQDGFNPVLGDLVTGSPLRTVQLVRDSDDLIVFSNSDFLSPNHLCALALRPPGEQTLNETVNTAVKEKLAEQFASLPFKMRSDTSVTVTENCDARAELLSTSPGTSNIRIVARVLENVLDLFLTTPDIGPLGLPSSADPHGVFKFDLELHLTIVVPPLAGQQLTTTNSGVKSTNAGIVRTNATFKLVDRVAKLLGDDGPVTQLLREREIDRPISENFLRDINSQVDRLPFAVPYVASYDRGSGTLTLRTTE